MTFHINDKDMKMKWLNKYKEDMNLHKEKLEQERQRKLQEEQEYLTKIRKEVDEEKMRQRENKKLVVQDELNEYYKHLTNKEQEELKNYEERRNKDNVSLNLGNEERLERMKQYLNQLSDNVDKNMNNYLNFKSGHQGDLEGNGPYNNGNIDQLNNYYDPKYFRKETDIHQNKKELYHGQNNNYNFNKANEVTSLGDSNNDGYLDHFYQKNYQEYKELQKRVFNYNKGMINNKIKTKESEFNDRKKTNEERLRELDHLHQQEQDERNFREHKQRIYRNLLDDQAHSHTQNIVGNTLSYSVDPLRPSRERIIPNNNSTFNNDKYYPEPSQTFKNPKEINTPSYAKNREINPNPFNTKKRYDLGSTLLEHNTILNPVHNYRYNRYLYYDNDVKYTPNSNNADNNLTTMPGKRTANAVSAVNNPNNYYPYQEQHESPYNYNYNYNLNKSSMPNNSLQTVGSQIMK